MWSVPLARPVAAAAAIGPFAMARRTYALKSHKIQAVVHRHKKAQEKDRVMRPTRTFFSPSLFFIFSTRTHSMSFTTKTIDKVNMTCSEVFFCLVRT
jgi:hypothetical protein